MTAYFMLCLSLGTGMKDPRMSGHFLPYPRATDINDIDIMDGMRKKKFFWLDKKATKHLAEQPVPEA